MKWIKQLFCKHNYKYWKYKKGRMYRYSCLYLDEYIDKYYRCSKCGKVKIRKFMR